MGTESQTVFPMASMRKIRSCSSHDRWSGGCRGVAWGVGGGGEVCKTLLVQLRKKKPLGAELWSWRTRWRHLESQKVGGATAWQPFIITISRRIFSIFFFFFLFFFFNGASGFTTQVHSKKKRRRKELIKGSGSRGAIPWFLWQERDSPG